MFFVQFQSFLTATLCGQKWSVSGICRFKPKEELPPSSSHCTGALQSVQTLWRGVSKAKAEHGRQCT
jgi:hypothetical protein